MDCYNHYHLGDCIYSLIFLNTLIENNPELKINFGCNPLYQYELKFHAHPNITLVPFGMTGTNLWIQAENKWGEYINNTSKADGLIYYDTFYLEFYNHLADRLGFPHYFNKLEDTFYYNDDLEIRRYQDYDFLILNTAGFSGQYDYSHADFIKFVKSDLQGYKVITIDKVDGVPSTREMKMNLLDIANLSIGCKYVIGVQTAPYATVLNKISADSVRKWVVLNDKMITYRYSNFQLYDNINDVDVKNILYKSC